MNRTKFNVIAGILLTFCLLICFFASCTSSKDVVPQLHVAAASDLVTSFEEIAREFEKTRRIKVVLSFGASGILTRQIENGAPMDVFAAANVGFIDQLEQKDLIQPETKAVYARGRIILWQRKDSNFKIESIADLARSEVSRVAIANPDYAPYGMAAREALQSAGIWETVKPKLVYGENIRQTYQFAETGNVDVAIVALALNHDGSGRAILITEDLHQPINQGLAVIKSSKSESMAREFCSFVLGSQGQSILSKYGFGPGK